MNLLNTFKHAFIGRHIGANEAEARAMLEALAKGDEDMASHVVKHVAYLGTRWFVPASLLTVILFLMRNLRRSRPVSLLDIVHSSAYLRPLPALPALRRMFSPR